MKTLTLIPPAQAEALFDALEERPRDRFASMPWQDDDTPEEGSLQSSAARRSEAASRSHPQSQRRAA